MLHLRNTLVLLIASNFYRRKVVLVNHILFARIQNSLRVELPLTRKKHICHKQVENFCSKFTPANIFIFRFVFDTTRGWVGECVSESNRLKDAKSRCSTSWGCKTRNFKSRKFPSIIQTTPTTPRSGCHPLEIASVPFWVVLGW